MSLHSSPLFQAALRPPYLQGVFSKSTEIQTSGIPQNNLPRYFVNQNYSSSFSNLPFRGKCTHRPGPFKGCTAARRWGSNNIASTPTSIYPSETSYFLNETWVLRLVISDTFKTCCIFGHTHPCSIILPAIFGTATCQSPRTTSLYFARNRQNDPKNSPSISDNCLPLRLKLLLVSVRLSTSNNLLM